MDFFFTANVFDDGDKLWQEYLYSCSATVTLSLKVFKSTVIKQPNTEPAQYPAT